MQFIVHNIKHYMQDWFFVLWYPNLDENFQKISKFFSTLCYKKIDLN
jgi:hypothetical protein